MLKNIRILRVAGSVACTGTLTESATGFAVKANMLLDLATTVGSLLLTVGNIERDFRACHCMNVLSNKNTQ